MQYMVPCEGPQRLHHIIWLRNLSTFCDLVVIHEDHHLRLWYRYSCMNAPDLKVCEILKLLDEMLVLYAGSRAEQLTMDATCGYKQPDIDVMLIFNPYNSSVMCVNNATDPAYCLVEVTPSHLDNNLRDLTHRWKNKNYLSAELFRERAMNIAMKNRGVDEEWSTLELHGPACKTSLTSIGKLDIIVCVAHRGAFCESNQFKERKHESYWLDVVPLNLLCHINGVLVPTCFPSLPRWCRQAAVVFKHTVLRHLHTIARDPRNDPVICSYHLKTIFLWAVESINAEMWASPVRLLIELLNMFTHAFRNRELKNYWVPTSNLLRYHSAKYLDECCQTVKVITDYITINVTFGGQDIATVKDVYLKSSHTRSERQIDSYLPGFFLLMQQHGEWWWNWSLKVRDPPSVSNNWFGDAWETPFWWKCWWTSWFFDGVIHRGRNAKGYG